MNPAPLFSIITVCFNSERHIIQCIESVVAQTYKDYEYIVVDGESEDATLNILDNYQEAITELVSEKDNGIYHAMNKGLDLARGDIIFFLNSDDCFHDCEVLRDVANAFSSSGSLDIVFGDQIRTNGTYNKVLRQPDSVTRVRLARRTLQHQTIFAKRVLFDKTDGFDESLKVVADYKWILDVFLRLKCEYRHIERLISVMSSQGISGTESFESERIRVMKEYYSDMEIFLYRKIPFLATRLRRMLFQ